MASTGFVHYSVHFRSARFRMVLFSHGARIQEKIRHLIFLPFGAEVGRQGAGYLGQGLPHSFQPDGWVRLPRAVLEKFKIQFVFQGGSSWCFQNRQKNTLVFPEMEGCQGT